MTPAAVTDFSQYTQLRASARAQDPEALRATAKQFEALFMQQMLKAMRDASPGEDLMGSEQTDFYRDMFDQQLAVHLSAGKGLGIADLMLRQMQANAGALPTTAPATPAQAAAPVAPAAGTSVSGATSTDASRSAFVQQLLPHAEKAAAALGVSPRTLIAQAALETGWGRHMIRQSDGSSALNFFGIKADKGYAGARAQSATSEYVNGQKTPETAQFRAYASIGEAFDDYVRFVQDNPRYRAALAHGGSDQRYAQGLQQAGYATDPDYAAKIQRVAGSAAMGGTVDGVA